MEEQKQNKIGIIALISIVIIIVLIWLFFLGGGSDSEDNGVILTPLEVTADPASYTDREIKVEGIVIARNQDDSSFIIMPIDIYISCDRNAYCGEEYTHLNVKYENTIPALEHDVIVTGNLNKIANGTYVLHSTKIIDKGKI